MSVALFVVISLSFLSSTFSLQSSYRCINSDLTFTQPPFISQADRPEVWTRNTCEFRNICFSGRTKSFLFYTTKGYGHFGKKSPDDPLLITSIGNRKNETYGTHDLVPFPLKLSFESMPNNSWNENNAIVYQPYSAWNIGHLLNDDFFPIYIAMRAFHFHQPDLILWLDCSNDWLYPGFVDFVTRCESTLKRWMPILNLSWTFIDESKDVCFRRVVAGLHPLTWSISKATYGDQLFLGFLYQDMIHKLLHNLPSSSRLPRQNTESASHKTLSVLILDKEESSGQAQRKIMNANEIASFIKDTFLVHVKVLPLSRNLSVFDELREIRSSNIILTGDGGAAWTTVFSMENTAVIYVDWFDHSINKSRCVECWWSTLPYIQTLQYRLDASEVTGTGRNGENYHLSLQKIHATFCLVFAQLSFHFEQCMTSVS